MTDNEKIHETRSRASYPIYTDPTKLPLTGGTLTGNLILSNAKKVTSTAVPTEDKDVTNKLYVDGSLSTSAAATAAALALKASIVYVDAQDALKLSLTGGALSGPLALGSNRITGLAPGVDPTDAATVSQTGAAGFVARTGDVMEGNLDFDALYKVTGLAAPTPGSADAATALYTDTADNLRLLKAGGTVTGAIAMSSNKITGLANPTAASQDAATASYVDTADALKADITYVDTADNLRLLKAGGTVTGAIAMSSNKITGLANPTAASQDAATASYTDTADALRVLKTGDTMSGPLLVDTVRATTSALLYDNTATASLAYKSDSDVQVASLTAWTSYSGASTQAWKSVCYSPELNRAVAVGGAGAASTQVMYSDNGTVWTAATASSATTWTSVTWSSHRMVFVAVAPTTSMVSKDGIVWSAGTTALVSCFAVTYAEALGYFVAVTSFTTAFYYSEDGVVWTTTPATGHTPSAVAWSPSLKVLVTVDLGGGGSSYYSYDAVTWYASATSVTGAQAVCWSSERAIFVAVGTLGRNYYSSNGTTWTAGTATSGATDLTAVDYSADLGVFLATQSTTSGVSGYYSATAVGAWTAFAGPASSQSWSSVVWASGFNKYLLVSDTGVSSANAVGTNDSPTSVNTSLSLATRNTSVLSAGCRSATLKATAAVYLDTPAIRTTSTASELALFDTNTAVNVAYKPSETVRADILSTWTTNSSIGSLTVTSACYAPEIDTYVAVSDTTSGSNSALYSVDSGRTWTAVVAPSTSRTWKSVCWSPALRLFVAVASNGLVAQQVMTSPDGITWSGASSASVRTWISVCWSPDKLLFVAVADSGVAAGAVMYSSTGTGTWTTATAATANGYNSICWVPKMSVFYAVGQNKAMWSTLGVTWSAVVTVATGNYSGVCYSPLLELIVMVSSTNIAYSSSATGTVTSAFTQSLLLEDICWSAETAMFVALGQSGGGVAGYYSSTGSGAWYPITGLETSGPQTYETVIWSATDNMFLTFHATKSHTSKTVPTNANRTLQLGTYDTSSTSLLGRTVSLGPVTRLQTDAYFYSSPQMATGTVSAASYLSYYNRSLAGFAHYDTNMQVAASGVATPSILTTGGYVYGAASDTTPRCICPRTGHYFISCSFLINVSLARVKLVLVSGGTSYNIVESYAEAASPCYDMVSFSTVQFMTKGSYVAVLVSAGTAFTGTSTTNYGNFTYMELPYRIL